MYWKCCPLSIAAAVRVGQRSAVSVVEEALGAVENANPRLNAFDQVFAAQAVADAVQVDLRRAQGRDPGRLAGVPFAAKSLFDVAGHITVARALARRNAPAAVSDAFAVAQLKQQGAILVGTTHMDELACGATGETPHFGPVHNPPTGRYRVNTCRCGLASWCSAYWRSISRRQVLLRRAPA